MSLLWCFQLVCKEKVVLLTAPEVKHEWGQEISGWCDHHSHVHLVRTFCEYFMQQCTSQCTFAIKRYYQAKLVKRNACIRVQKQRKIVLLDFRSLKYRGRLYKIVIKVNYDKWKRQPIRITYFVLNHYLTTKQ